MSIHQTARRVLRHTMLAAATCAALAAAAQAEIDGVEIIAPAGPGGGYDQLARADQAMLEKPGARLGRAGDERPRCRRHHRPRPVRHRQVRGSPAARHRPRDGRRHQRQQVAGHARPGDAAGAADRRVPAAGGRAPTARSRRSTTSPRCSRPTRARSPGAASPSAAPTTCLGDDRQGVGRRREAR